MAILQGWRKLGPIMACVSMTVMGCAVSGRSMQMDSTSKMPWFNLELRQAKPKSSEVPFREARSDRKESRIEALGLSRSGSNDAKLAANQAVPSKTSLPVNEPQHDVERVGNFEESTFDFH